MIKLLRMIDIEKEEGIEKFKENKISMKEQSKSKNQKKKKKKKST